MRRTNGDSVDALAPFYWRSSFGGKTTTVVTPVLRSHRARRAQLGAGAAHLPRPNPERTHHRHPAAAHLPPLRGGRRTRGSGRRCYVHKHDKHSSTTTVFPLYWAWTRQQREVGDRIPALLARGQRQAEPFVDARGPAVRLAIGQLADARHPAPRLVLARLRGRLRVKRVDAAVLPGERARPRGRSTRCSAATAVRGRRDSGTRRRCCGRATPSPATSRAWCRCTSATRTRRPR